MSPGALVRQRLQKRTLVLCASLPGTKFLLLWHSSNTRQPSKEDPPAQETTFTSLIHEHEGRATAHMYVCHSQDSSEHAGWQDAEHEVKVKLCSPCTAAHAENVLVATAVSRAHLV